MKKYKIIITVLILLFMAPVSIFACVVNKNNSLEPINTTRTSAIVKNVCEDTTTNTTRHIYSNDELGSVSGLGEILKYDGKSGIYKIYGETDYINFVRWTNKNGFAGDVELCNSFSLGDKSKEYNPILEEWAEGSWFYGRGYTIWGLSSFCEINNGYIYGLTVYDGSCQLNANVTDTKDELYGLYGSGVIAGINKGTISECGVYNSSISGSHAGAIAGINTGTISNCYSYANTITSSVSAGGIAGFICGSSTIHHCISADNEISGGETGGSESIKMTGGIAGMAFVMAKNGNYGGSPMVSGASITNCFSSNDDVTSQMCPVEQQFLYRYNNLDGYKAFHGGRIDKNDLLSFSYNYSDRYGNNFYTAEFSEVPGVSYYYADNYQYYVYANYCTKPGIFLYNTSFTAAPASESQSWWRSGEYTGKVFASTAEDRFEWLKSKFRDEARYKSAFVIDKKDDKYICVVNGTLYEADTLLGLIGKLNIEDPYWTMYPVYQLSLIGWGESLVICIGTEIDILQNKTEDELAEFLEEQGLVEIIEDETGGYDYKWLGLNGYGDTCNYINNQTWAETPVAKATCWTTFPTDTAEHCGYPYFGDNYAAGAPSTEPVPLSDYTIYYMDETASLAIYEKPVLDYSGDKKWIWEGEPYDSAEIQVSVYTEKALADLKDIDYLKNTVIKNLNNCALRGGFSLAEGKANTNQYMVITGYYVYPVGSSNAVAQIFDVDTATGEVYLNDEYETNYESKIKDGVNYVIKPIYEALGMTFTADISSNYPKGGELYYGLAVQRSDDTSPLVNNFNQSDSLSIEYLTTYMDEDKEHQIDNTEPKTITFGDKDVNCKNLNYLLGMNIEVNAKSLYYRGDGDNAASFVYCYFDVLESGEDVEWLIPLETIVGERPSADNLGSHYAYGSVLYDVDDPDRQHGTQSLTFKCGAVDYADVENGYTYNETKKGYHSTISVTLHVKIYVEMDMVARIYDTDSTPNVNKTYFYNVLYGTQCIYEHNVECEGTLKAHNIREHVGYTDTGSEWPLDKSYTKHTGCEITSHSFGAVNPPSVSGYKITYYSQPNKPGDSFAVASQNLKFLTDGNKYLAEFGSGNYGFANNSTVTTIYASREGIIGKYSYSITSYTQGTPIRGSTTSLSLKVLVEVEFDNTTMYLNGGSLKNTGISIAVADKQTLEVTVEDTQILSYTINGTTTEVGDTVNMGYGYIKQINFYVTGYAYKPTSDAGYILKADDKITSNDLAKTPSSDVYGVSASTSSTTWGAEGSKNKAIEWEPSSNDSSDYYVAELQRIELWDTGWGDQNNPTQTIYQVSGEDVRTGENEINASDFKHGLNGWYTSSSNHSWISVEPTSETAYEVDYTTYFNPTDGRTKLNARYTNITVNYLKSDKATYDDSVFTANQGWGASSVDAQGSIPNPSLIVRDFLDQSPILSSGAGFVGWNHSDGTPSGYENNKYYYKNGTSAHISKNEGIESATITKNWIGLEEYEGEYIPVIYIYEVWDDGSGDSDNPDDDGETIAVNLVVYIYENDGSGEYDEGDSERIPLTYKKNSDGKWVCTTSVSAPAPGGGSVSSGYVFSYWEAVNAYSQYYTISNDKKTLTMNAVSSFTTTGGYVFISVNAYYDESSEVVEPDEPDPETTYRAGGQYGTIEYSFSIASKTIDKLGTLTFNFCFGYMQSSATNTWTYGNYKDENEYHYILYDSVVKGYNKDYIEIINIRFESIYDTEGDFVYGNDNISNSISRVQVCDVLVKDKYFEEKDCSFVYSLEKLNFDNTIGYKGKFTGVIKCGLKTVVAKFDIVVGEEGDGGETLIECTYFANLDAIEALINDDTVFSKLFKTGTVSGSWDSNDTMSLKAGDTITSELSTISYYATKNDLTFLSFLPRDGANSSVMTFNKDGNGNVKTIKINALDNWESYRLTKSGSSWDWNDNESGKVFSLNDVGTEFATDDYIDIHFGIYNAGEKTFTNEVTNDYVRFQYGAPRYSGFGDHLKYDITNGGWTTDSSETYVTFGQNLQDTDEYKNVFAGIDYSKLKIYYSTDEGKTLIDLEGKIINSDITIKDRKTAMNEAVSLIKDVKGNYVNVDVEIYIVYTLVDANALTITLRRYENSTDDIDNYGRDVDSITIIADPNDEYCYPIDAIYLDPFSAWGYWSFSCQDEAGDDQGYYEGYDSSCWSLVDIDINGLVKVQALGYDDYDLFYIGIYEEDDGSDDGGYLAIFIHQDEFMRLYNDGKWPKDNAMTIKVCYNISTYILQREENGKASSNDDFSTAYSELPLNCNLTMTKLLVDIKYVYSVEIRGGKINNITLKERIDRSEGETISYSSTNEADSNGYCKFTDYYYNEYYSVQDRDRDLYLKCTNNGTSCTLSISKDTSGTSISKDDHLTYGLLHILSEKFVPTAQFYIYDETDSAETSLGQQKFNYADDGPFGYNFNTEYSIGTEKIIENGSYQIKYTFKGWKIEFPNDCDETKAKRLFNSLSETDGLYNKSTDLKTCDSKITDMYDSFKINLIAVYEKVIDRVDITVENKCGSTVLNTKNYEFFYNPDGTEGSDALTPSKNTISPMAIIGYTLSGVDYSPSQFISGHDATTLVVSLTRPSGVHGIYSLTITYTYTQNTTEDDVVKIEVNYVDKDNDDPLGSAEYLFYYTDNTKTGENVLTPSKNTISPADIEDRVVCGVEYKDDTHGFWKEYDATSFVVTLQVPSGVSGDCGTFTITFYYSQDTKNDIAEITVEYVDENGDDISDFEPYTYYYHDDTKTQGDKFKGDTFTPKTIAGYSNPTLSVAGEAGLYSISGTTVTLKSPDSSVHGAKTLTITYTYKQDSSKDDKLTIQVAYTCNGTSIKDTDTFTYYYHDAGNSDNDITDGTKISPAEIDGYEFSSGINGDIYGFFSGSKDTNYVYTFTPSAISSDPSGDITITIAYLYNEAEVVENILHITVNYVDEDEKAMEGTSVKEYDYYYIDNSKGDLEAGYTISPEDIENYTIASTTITGDADSKLYNKDGNDITLLSPSGVTGEYNMTITYKYKRVYKSATLKLEYYIDNNIKETKDLGTIVLETTKSEGFDHYLGKEAVIKVEPVYENATFLQFDYNNYPGCFDVSSSITYWLDIKASANFSDGEEVTVGVYYKSLTTLYIQYYVNGEADSEKGELGTLSTTLTALSDGFDFYLGMEVVDVPATRGKAQLQKFGDDVYTYFDVTNSATGNSVRAKNDATLAWPSEITIDVYYVDIATGSLILDIYKQLDEGEKTYCERVIIDYKEYTGTIRYWTFCIWGKDKDASGNLDLIDTCGFTKWEIEVSNSNFTLVSVAGYWLCYQYDSEVAKSIDGVVTVTATAYFSSATLKITYTDNVVDSETGKLHEIDSSKTEKIGDRSPAKPYDPYTDDTPSYTTPSEIFGDFLEIRSSIENEDEGVTYNFMYWQDASGGDGWASAYYDKSGKNVMSGSSYNLKITKIGTGEFNVNAVYTSMESVVITVKYLSTRGNEEINTEDETYEYFYAYKGEGKPSSDYTALIYGDTITAKSVAGHTFYGWECENDALNLFEEFKHKVYNTNPVTLAQYSTYSGSKAITLTAYLTPDVARITVERQGSTGTLLKTDEYDYYYNSSYKPEQAGNVLNAGDLIPTDCDGYEFKSWGTFETGSIADTFINRLNAQQLQLKDLSSAAITGVQEFTIIAIYKANSVEISVYYTLDGGESKTELKTTEAHNYRDPQYAGKVIYDVNAINSGLPNTADPTKALYEYKGFELGTDANKFIEVTGSVAKGKSVDASISGEYEVDIIFFFEEQPLAVINVEYNDLAENEIYIFPYRGGDYSFANYKVIDFGYSITRKEIAGRTFITWEVDGKFTGTNGIFQSYSSGEISVITRNDPLTSDSGGGFVSVTITAEYELAYYIIDIDYEDENGNGLSGDTEYYYYYNGDTPPNATNPINAGDKFTAAGYIKDGKNSYVFKEMIATDETYGYVTISGDTLTVVDPKPNVKIDDLHYRLIVKCVYASTASYKFNLNIEYRHLEEEYYNGKTTAVDTKNYELDYHNLSGATITPTTPTGYSPMGWGTSTVSGYDASFGWDENTSIIINGTTIQFVTYSGLRTQKRVDKSCMTEGKLSGYTFYGDLPYVDVKTAITCNYTTLSEEQIKLIDLYISEGNKLTLTLVYYISNPICIRKGTDTASAIKQDWLAVTYVIDNSNFMGGTFIKEFKVVLPWYIVYDYTADFEIWSDNYKGYIDAEDKRDYQYYNIKEYYEESAYLDVTLYEEDVLTQYAPNAYAYAGWGLQKAVTSGAKNASMSELLDEMEKHLNLTNFSTRPYIEYKDGETAKLYMQYEPRKYTVSCSTFTGNYNFNYTANGAGFGIVLLDFITEINKEYYYNKEQKYVGTYSNVWTIKSMSAGSGEDSYAFYDKDGHELSVGDEIDLIYSGSYGNIVLKTTVESWVDVAIELNYRVTTSQLGENIYTNGTNAVEANDGSNLRYYLTGYHANSVVNLESLLSSNYNSTTPATVTTTVTTTVGGTDYRSHHNYYLAGWTFLSGATCAFTPARWDNVTYYKPLTETEKKIYNSFLTYGSQTTNYLKSKMSISDGYWDAIQRISLYETLIFNGNLTSLYGKKLATVNGVDDVSVVTLYAVWLPYFKIELSSRNVYRGDNCDIWDGTTHYHTAGDNDDTNSYYMYYGPTLPQKAMTVSYDIMTMVGKTPNIEGVSVGLEGHYLTGFNITAGWITGYAYRDGGAGWDHVGDDEKEKYFYHNLTDEAVDFYSIIRSQIKLLKDDMITYPSATSSTSNPLIVIKPSWTSGNIDLNLKTQGFENIDDVTTTIYLDRGYAIKSSEDTLLRDKYSIKSIFTDKNEKGVEIPIVGARFDYSTLSDEFVIGSKTIYGYSRQCLNLDAYATYVGDIYLLKIYSMYSIDDYTYGGLDNREDIDLAKIESDVNFISMLNYTYKYIKLQKADYSDAKLADYSDAKLIESEYKTISKFKMHNYWTTDEEYIEEEDDEYNYYDYFDFSELYEAVKNKIVLYSDTLYLCLAYGDTIEDIDGNSLVQNMSYGESKLGFYAYFGTQNNNVYCYDMENGEGIIEYEGVGKILPAIEYTAGKNPICTKVWAPGDMDETNYWIGAVWDKRVYYLDLAVQLEDINKADSNSGYITVKVSYDDDPTDPKKRDTTGYILVYEKQGYTYGYYMYTLTESEFNAYSVYYGGWNSIATLKREKTTLVAFNSDAIVEVKIYDQSKDSGDDCMIGYRLDHIEISAPEIEEKSIDVNATETVSYNGMEYGTIAGYSTNFEFAGLEMDDETIIKFKAVLKKIVYSLIVCTEKEYGGVEVVYKSVTYSEEPRHEFTTINVGDSLGAKFLVALGYELDAWRLNGSDFGEMKGTIDDYTIQCEFDATFLRTYVYANGVFDVSPTQDIGELRADAKLIEFDIKVLFKDINAGVTLQEYKISEKADSLIGISKTTRARSVTNKITLSAEDEAYVFDIDENKLTTLGSDPDIYYVYNVDGTNYAIIGMYVNGKANVYSKISYDFPILSYDGIEFALDKATLSDLVEFSKGYPVSEGNRVINLAIQCAKVFEIKAVDSISAPRPEDPKKKTRSLKAGPYSTILARGDNGAAITSTGNVCYAYENQEVIVWITAAKEYYKSAIVSSDQLDPKEYELTFSDNLKITPKENISLDVLFDAKVKNYTVDLRYNEVTYKLDDYAKIVSLSNESIIKIKPTIKITGPAPAYEVRDTKFYYNDILTLTLAENWLISSDYKYIVSLNGTSKSNALILGEKFTFTFYENDLNIVIDISPKTKAVEISLSDENGAEVIAKTNTGKEKKIEGTDTILDLMPGENLEIYFKENAGYKFTRYTHGATQTTLNPSPVTGAESQYSYMFTLITNFTADRDSGTYQLVFEKIEYDVTLKYYVHDEEQENSLGAEYEISGDTEFDETGKCKISSTVYVKKTKDPDARYTFICYSIGGHAETADKQILVDDDNDGSITIKPAEYIATVANDGKLIVYINYIRNYKVTVTVKDEFRMSETKFIDIENEKTPIQTIKVPNEKKEYTYTSNYLGESAYTNVRYKLIASAGTSKNYYIELYLGGEKLIPIPDNNVEGDAIDGMTYWQLSYEFDLNSDLKFEVVCMPVEYSVTFEEHYYDTMGKLEQKENSVLQSFTLTGEKLDANISPKVEIVLTTDRSDLLNRHGTQLTISIKIATSTKNKDYAFYMLTIDGVGITNISTKDETIDGITYTTYTYTHEVKENYTIGVHYKQCYEIDVGVS